MDDYKPLYQNEVSDFIKQELAKQNKPLNMIYTGYSSHDCEAWYKCPKCQQAYGSWGFVNGSIIQTDGKFRCRKCNTILNVPE